MDIFFCPVMQSADAVPVSALLEKLPPEYRSFREPAVLLGRIFLRSFLCERLSLANDALTVLKGSRGKPYVNAPLFFNLSHTKGAFALAAGKEEMGLDLEKSDRPVSECTVKRLGLPREDPLLGWMKREAEGKCTGEGALGRKDPDRFTFTLWEREGFRMVLCTGKPVSCRIRTLSSEQVISYGLALRSWNDINTER